MPNMNTARKPAPRGPPPKDPVREVQDIIRMIRNTQRGKTISIYHLRTRKEITYSKATVAVVLGVGADADRLEGVPKLALLVTSTIFREYIEKKPEVTEVKVVSPSINLAAAANLLNWIKDVAHSEEEVIAQVPVPASLVDKAQLVHAAHVLGMSSYVNHVIKSFKEDIRSQIPSPQDCKAFDTYSVSADDEIIKAVGERFGYLLRNHKFPGSRKMLSDFLANNEWLTKAIRDADARVLAKRVAQLET